MTSFQPRKAEKTIDFSHEELFPVFIKQDVQAKQHTELLPKYQDNKLLEIIKKTKHQLLFATDKLLSEDIIIALQNLVESDNNINVYICLGNIEENKTAIDRLKSRCLVRTGVSQAGAMVISDPHYFDKKGLAITCLESGFLLALNDQQIEDTYRSFCFHFWNSTNREFFGEIERDAKPAPSQVVLNDEYHKEAYFINPITFDVATISTPNLVKHIDSAEYSSLLSNPNYPDLNKQSVSKKAKIALSEQNLPSFVFESGNNRAWLLPEHFDKNKVNWVALLDEEQKKQVATKLDSLIEQAEWQLSRQPKTKDLQSLEFIKAECTDSNPLCIKDNKTLELEDKFCDSFDEYFIDEPLTFFKEQMGWDTDYLSKTVTFESRVHPPYLPKNAKEDKLKSEWQNIQNKWEDTIEKAVASINGLKVKEESQKGKPFANLLSQFWLGKSRTLSGYKTELEDLKTCELQSLSPSTRFEKESKLIALIKQIVQSGSDINKQTTYAEATHKWQRELESLEHDFKKANKAKEDIEMRNNQQAPSLKKQLNQLETDYGSKLNEYLASLDEDKRETLAKKLETLAKAQQFLKDKKSKKLHHQFNETVKQLTEKNRNIENTLSDLDKALTKSLNDYDIAADKLQNHKKNEPKIQAEDNSLDSQLGIKDKELSKFNLPTEDLPYGGLKLMVADNQRYIVVNHESELKQARYDANRLNAKLCTQKGDDHA
ncbi:hypothetical protein [Pseudoalteromonas aurantia]|uniref:Uncharacterized protein n=2 Tax=Pseudoalteromonas TaxID=53246 RepID=A0ABY2VUE1_9GAMM|nr:hypothetical protein [Pseudoalteromonas aurantia]TMO71923.1 hypothetical protein CWC20_16345 [Pseudoalteromonas aurantia]